jgi:hypothetical protein
VIDTLVAPARTIFKNFQHYPEAFLIFAALRTSLNNAPSRLVSGILQIAPT